MHKKISVVIPTYNRAGLLMKCIHALSQQDFDKEDFEIIVVSDGPDGATRYMLNELIIPLPFMQYISLAKNRGPAAARNAGWRVAGGKLIAFTDDDCLPKPDWLSNLWRMYISNGEPPLMAFTGRVIVPVSDNPTDYEINTAHLQNADFITANCACTKKSLELTDGFDERFTTAWREDSDLEFRLMEKGIFIQRKINAAVVHPVRKADWGVSIKEQRKTIFNALLYKKFPSLFRQKIQPVPAWNYYAIIIGFLLMLTGVAVSLRPLFFTGLIIYSCLTFMFIWKRLVNTSKEFNHVIEMIVTSLVIPFISIYWTIRGALKYKVFYY
ncbi:MAG: glycosyltransferase [Chitinophagaceae bacterium]|nr:glycosyltransferase [Chitinophagaceae bacterium]